MSTYDTIIVEGRGEGQVKCFVRDMQNYSIDDYVGPICDIVNYSIAMLLIKFYYFNFPTIRVTISQIAYFFHSNKYR